MEIEIKLNVRPAIEGGPVTLFARLVMLSKLAGEPLGPVSKIELRDVYYDTADGVLARAGAGLRLRLINGKPYVTLKLSKFQDGALTQREEFEEPLTQERLDWVLSHVHQLVGAGPYPVKDFAVAAPCGTLAPALDVGTARLVRKIGKEALLVLDMVEYPGLALEPYWEIEVESRAGSAGEKLLRRVETELYALADGHIMPARLTKLERGFKLKKQKVTSGT